MTRKDCVNQREPRPARTRRAVTAAVGALLCGAAPAPGQVICLQDAAVVDRGHIVLADVALLQGFPPEETAALQDTVLGAAPAPGRQQALELQHLRARLAENGLNLATVRIKGASRCTVRRPTALPRPAPHSSRIDGPTLEQRIRKLLVDRLSDQGGVVEVTPIRGPAGLLQLRDPDGQFDISVRSPRKLGNTEVVVTRRSPQGGAEAERLLFKVGLTTDVVVAARTIPRGQSITRDDVLLESRRFAKLQLVGLSSPAEVIGQQARRIIRTGDMIQATDIKPRLLVQRNELLRVRSRGDGIALHSAARALKAGGLGDIIEVRNEASQLNFWGRISGLRQIDALAGPHDEAPGGRAP